MGVKITVMAILFGGILLKVGFGSNKYKNELANEPVKKEEEEQEKQLFEEFDNQWNGMNEAKNEPASELVNEMLSLSENELNMIRLMAKNRDITQDEIAGILHLSKSSVKRNIAKLKEKEWITRVDADKKGYWKILK